jgi:hypothetical protein
LRYWQFFPPEPRPALRGVRFLGQQYCQLFNGSITPPQRVMLCETAIHGRGVPRSA